MTHAFRVLVPLVLLLAACSSPKHTLGRPSAEVAVVEGRDHGFQVIPLGTEGSISILSIDGEELATSALGGAPKSVELLPGPHRIGIYYTFYVDGSPGPRGETTLEVDVEAGKRYRIEESFEAGGAMFTLIEVTEGG
jgi:hypothetical protein